MTNKQATRAPRIIVSNVFGDVNRGGAAITAQTIRVAHAVGARVIGVTINDGADAGRTHPHTSATFPDVRLVESGLAVRPGPLTGLRRTLKSLYYLVFATRVDLPVGLAAIAHSDLVISKGGYVFVDRASGKAFLRLWSTVYPLVFARRLGIATMAFPTSIGRHRHLMSRLLCRWVLSGMELVAPRDPLSRQAAEILGVPAAIVHEFPDIVFGMDPPAAAAVRHQCAALGLTPGRYITMTVVLPPDQVERERLTRTLAETAAALRRDPRVDRIVLVDQAGDTSATALLAGRLKGDCLVVDADLSPESLIALYGGSLLTVACRLHSAIFSFVAGTPAVAVSISPDKAEGVFASLGLPTHWVVTRAQADKLPDRALEVIRDAPPRDQLLHRVSALKEELAELQHRVADVLRLRARGHMDD